MELSSGHGTSSDENVEEEQNDLGIDMGEANREKVDESYRRITELTYEDILGLEFDTEGEAIDFYHNYSRCHGFVMRRDDVGRDLRGNINMRQLVCNKEGKRSEKHLQRLDRVREHKPLTRTGCQAKIHFHRDYKTGKWKVVAFEESHNHELIPSSMVHLIPAYRGLSNADKAQVNILQSHGVRTCHIMGYMVAQKGGYAHVGFTKKDLYNHIDRNRRAKMIDGDANAALIYLWAKADHDPLLQGIYTLTDDGKLLNLFWADGTSLIDYECFGDVIAFDTTYKKNKYNKPLVIFSGSNHHGHTTIFGCALINDEKFETYKWVLEAFLEAMSNKHPKAVVTDGDGAMREAIKEVFPNATHRLCAWHLHRNACENVKHPQFLEDFKSLIYGNFTPTQFEDLWKEVKTKHGLSSNKWVSKTYENKEMWATAYLRDTFFGHIRTTSQCEGINSFIKSYIRKKCSLLDFMHNFQNALREYRNNELIVVFSCMFLDPVMTTCLQEIEKHASKVYTRDIFKEVKSQLEDV